MKTRILDLWMASFCVALLAGAVFSIEHDSTTVAASSLTQGLYAQLPIFAQTVDVTVANSMAETTLIGSGTGGFPGATLPRGYFIPPGYTLHIQARGVFSALSNPNLTLNVKLNGMTVLTTGAVASQNGTNAGYVLDATLTTRGATGPVVSIEAQGTLTQAGTAPVFLTNAAPVAVTLGATVPVDLTAQWGTAALTDSITATNITVENGL